MRMNKIKGLVTRGLLVVSLLAGFVVFTGTTADAQWRRGRVVVRPRVFVYPRTYYPRSYWYGRSYFYTPPTHVTEGQGYNDGLHDGRDDAKHGKGYSPYSHNSYKNSMSSAYTDGFLRGYADGFREIGG